MSSGVLVPQLDCKLFESKDLNFYFFGISIQLTMGRNEYKHLLTDSVSSTLWRYSLTIQRPITDTC